MADNNLFIQDPESCIKMNGQQLDLKAFGEVYGNSNQSRVKYWTLCILGIILLFMFLPWTQNIRARGAVTTLRQEQRPQEINTIIPGKVKKWYVKEGDVVKAGDTIIQLTEIKDDYLDPSLLNRTEEQLNAKRSAVESYGQKASSTEQQLTALQNARDLKLSELRNKLLQQRMKIESDSMELVAARNDQKIKELQYQRQVSLYDSGLVSLTQLEQRNQAKQESIAKRTSAEIKLGNARQELLRIQIELNGTNQEYEEKISKTIGDRYQALSQVASGESEIAKLRNQFSNYTIRNGMYYITAPQSGQITKAMKAGIGEIVKEGEMLVEIVPDQLDYAVELFVKPMDLPLLDKGQKIRFVFDGFPAIVFSGWPSASYGTFGGEVVAVENSVSNNGQFRVLIKEDSADKKWPTELKMGTGANGIALLKNVPIWYELWRNINGFPPDYYKTKSKENTTASK